MRSALWGLLFGALAISANAQSVISAHSGVIHYVEGDVFASGNPVEMKFGHFPDLHENEILRTDQGRAEILLTPGSFLRVAENSEVRMLSNKLSDTRIELLKGEILVESVASDKDSAAAMVKGNSISVAYKDTSTAILKSGLFLFTSDPARVRVFEGEATVKSASSEVELKKGKQSILDGALVAEKFDSNEADELMRWSSRRSGYLAAANVQAARSLAYDPNMMSSYLGSGYGYGGWAYSPFLGMFTYVPFGGMGFSPFGYSYWSPYSVFYAPYGYGLGYGGPYTYGGGSSTGGGVYRAPGTVRQVGSLPGAGSRIASGFGARSGSTSSSGLGSGRSSGLGSGNSLSSTSTASSVSSLGGARGGGGGVSSGGHGR